MWCPRIVLSLLVVAPLAAQHEALRFDRDIRPILSDNCFKCHGPDAGSRKAKLRLDTRAGALAGRKHGRAIVPGDSAKSLLIQRIHHANPKKQMPPKDSGKSLTAHEKVLLARWIDAGAPWQGHWAYQPIEPPKLPAGTANHPVDRFLEARHRALGATPAPAADRRTLVRRLALDVTGLPPDRAAIAAAKAGRPGWYERLVSRLLRSDAYAERLTMYWLDLARYGDSCGIHGDQVVSMWPYRDYVIDAFRTNMRFDRFVREQLAGDLLPNPTLQQRVASGYNRLNIKTAEGGAQDKEYLAKYAADRVRNTAAAFLGSTMSCAECHDHKFDPFTTRDFYRFAAFFADLDHKGFYAGARWGPKIRVPTPAQAAQLAGSNARITAIEARLATPTAAADAALGAWEAATRRALTRSRPPILGTWRSIGPFGGGSNAGAHRRAFGPETDASPERSFGKLRWQPRPQWTDGKIHKLSGANSATYLYRSIDSPLAQGLALSLGSDDAIKVWHNGKLVLDRLVTRGVKPGQDKITLSLRQGRNDVLLKISNGTGGYGFYFKTARSGPPGPIVKILDVKPRQRTATQRRTLFAHFASVAPFFAADRAALAAAKKAKTDLEKRIPTSLVSQRRAQPRTIRVLPRGNWMDDSGPVVTPGVPAFLPQADLPTDRRLNRLDLAAWLTSRDNPLPARVFVNRLWKLFFGSGLATPLDDLGSQGSCPRHPELLDWLAAEFQRDWNVRRMIELLVTSAAYKRSSQPSPAELARDPENTGFARQNRFRLDAEIVRDQALAISGLLDRTVGGPSVKPYQPAGYWAQLNFPRRQWKSDTGSKQYRRGLYTHWQRTFLHPMLRAFDAPPREECTAERGRSNTPQQALALLNDPTFVEAARVFAQRILAAERFFPAQLQFAFRETLGRAPDATEIARMQCLYAAQLARYRKDPEAAEALLSVGLAPRAKTTPELAAWTALCRVLFNLHETITRN